MPWIGYFLKIAKSDVFVFLDNVQYSNGGYTNRVKVASIQSKSHSQWLTIPITKAPLESTIKNIEITGKLWISQHIAKVAQTYKKHIYFGECSEVIFPLLMMGERYSSLCEFNIFVIQEIASCLGIKAEFVKSSTLLQRNNSADAALIDIINALNGNIYLSGIGGRNYQSERLFDTNKIQILYSDPMSILTQKPYKQSIPTTNFGVSIIDMWMNIGLDGIRSFIAEHGKR
jgi:hypothetical protein